MPIENLPDETFMHVFDTCDVAPSEWTHRCHVRLAWNVLREGSFEHAIARVRDGIGRLNAKHGTPDGLERGYHETITEAWLRIVAAMISHHGPGADSRAFCDAHPQLLSSRLLRLYYTKARLVSWDAKRQFVEPDIAPLPSSQLVVHGPS